MEHGRDHQDRSDDLIFELHGVDQILAIKRSISVPLARVTSVSTDDVPWKVFQQVRVVGTSLPGVVKDGRFLDQDGMMFFEMHILTSASQST